MVDKWFDEANDKDKEKLIDKINNGYTYNGIKVKTRFNTKGEDVTTLWCDYLKLQLRDL